MPSWNHSWNTRAMSSLMTAKLPLQLPQRSVSNSLFENINVEMIFHTFLFNKIATPILIPRNRFLKPNATGLCMHGGKWGVFWSMHRLTGSVCLSESVPDKKRKGNAYIGITIETKTSTTFFITIYSLNVVTTNSLSHSTNRYF